MKYKTENFKDRAELYLWASEKKDIEYEGEIFKYGESGYYLSLSSFLSSYKKVIYTKTKQYWLWDVCDKNGCWHRTNSFMDENGRFTNNLVSYGDWNEVKKRKIEDSLLEIEE